MSIKEEEEEVQGGNDNSNPDRPLDVTEIKVLSYIEQLFWEQGGIPSNEIVADKLKLTLKSVAECWKRTPFRKALIARGISFSEIETDSDILDPRQILVANLLMNPLDRRSQRQKLEEVGVTTQQFNGWMRQIPFQTYLRRRAEELFKSSHPTAYLAFIQNVERGNMEAIKMFFEMTGVYSPKTQVDVNLDGILLRVVDVLSRYLTPEQLQQAASELESALPSRTGIMEVSSSSGNEPKFLDNSSRISAL